MPPSVPPRGLDPGATYLWRQPFNFNSAHESPSLPFLTPVPTSLNLHDPFTFEGWKGEGKKNWPECTDCEWVAQQQPSQQPPLCCASCECFINCHLLQEFLKATWFTLRCSKKKKINKKILFSLQQKRKASDTKVGFWSCVGVEPIVFGSGFFWTF